MAKAGEQCVFCGWSRRSSWPSVRFYNIPREPGLKKVRWLQSFANRKVSHRDRVCSVHFRSGRPSNDASHEDFAPHLYLDSEPPKEVMHYLDILADKDYQYSKVLAADASVELQESLNKRLIDLCGADDVKCVDKKNIKPAILQRHRKGIKEELVSPDENESCDGSVPAVPKAEVFEYPETSSSSVSSQSSIQPKQEGLKKLRIGNRTRRAIPLDRLFVESTGIQAGQTVTIKCRRSYPVVKKEEVTTESPAYQNEQKPFIGTVSMPPTPQSSYTPNDQCTSFQYPQSSHQYVQNSVPPTPMPPNPTHPVVVKEETDDLDDMPPLVERMEPNPEQIAVEQQHQMQLLLEEENDRLSAMENERLSREQDSLLQMQFRNFMPRGDEFELLGMGFNDQSISDSAFNDNSMESAFMQHPEFQFGFQHDLNYEDGNFFYNEVYDTGFDDLHMSDDAAYFNAGYDHFNPIDTADMHAANVQH
uniref:THAP-type domain-containing protein n=1 Tax=Panagrellus redivivus TaxID=6233 RepID=A0A7E4WBR6_PANRE